MEAEEIEDDLELVAGIAVLAVFVLVFVLVLRLFLTATRDDGGAATFVSKSTS